MRVRIIGWLAALSLGLGPTRGLGQTPKEPRVEDLVAASLADSNNVAAQYALGLGYWKKHRFDDAEHALRTAVTIDPRFAAGYLALGELPFARRHKLRKEVADHKVPPEWKAVLEEAQRNSRRALLVDPLVDLTIYDVVDPQPPVLSHNLGNVTVTFTNPFEAFIAGHYGVAFAFFDRLVYEMRERGVRLDSMPTGVLWYHGLSAAHVSAYDAAMADFRVLLARAEGLEQSDTIFHAPLRSNDFRYLLALVAQKAGRDSEAIALYQEALGFDVGLYMAHVQLYKIYESERRWDDALSEGEAALATNPEDPSIMFEYGVLYYEAGKLTAAADTLRRAMTANPREARAPYWLGITEEALGHYAEARSAYGRFLEIAPTNLSMQIDDVRARLRTLP